MELAVDEGSATAGGVGREDTDLAVVDLFGRAGVLPGHPGRRGALLDEPGVIDDQHAVRAELLSDVLAQVVSNGIGVPAGTVEQVLQPSRVTMSGILGQLPAVLAAHRRQQGADVVPHPPPQIRTTEPARHRREDGLQLLSPALDFSNPLHDRTTKRTSSGHDF